MFISIKYFILHVKPFVSLYWLTAYGLRLNIMNQFLVLPTFLDSSKNMNSKVLSNVHCHKNSNLISQEIVRILHSFELSESYKNLIIIKKLPQPQRHRGQSKLYKDVRTAMRKLWMYTISSPNSCTE